LPPPSIGGEYGKHAWNRRGGTNPGTVNGAESPALYYTLSFRVLHATMPISVRLSPRVEQQLAAYCAHAKLSKSEAVKLALERLFAEECAPAATNPAAKRFIGSDKRPGEIARHTKRLLREHFRGK